MIKIKVCAGSHCVLKGSVDMLEYLQNDDYLADKISIEDTACIHHHCEEDNSPIMEIDEVILRKATLEKVYQIIQEKLNDE